MIGCNGRAALIFPTREAAIMFMDAIPGMIKWEVDGRLYWDYADESGNRCTIAAECRFSGEDEDRQVAPDGPWSKFWTRYYDGNGGSTFFYLDCVKFGVPFTGWES